MVECKVSPVLAFGSMPWCSVHRNYMGPDGKTCPNGKPDRLVETLREVNRRFSYGPGKDDSFEFWLNMAESQIQDARAHLALGHPKERALAEIADLIPVAFDALEKLGVEPESFTEKRVRDRILSRVEEVHALYRDGDGHRARPIEEANQ